MSSNEPTGGDIMFSPPSQSHGAMPAVAAAHVQHGDGKDVVTLARRIFRGRWLAAALLALGLGVPAAIYGWSQARPLYRSEALIHIHPRVERILYDTPENESIARFPSYVGAQAALLQSSRVRDLARQELREKNDAAARAVASAVELREGLRVQHEHNAEIIQVHFIHEDPKAAKLALNALVDSYYRLHEERSDLTSERRRELLRNRIEELGGEIRAAERAMESKGTKYGTTDLEPIIKSHVEERNDIDRAIRRFDIQIATLQGREQEAPEQEANVAPAGEESLPALALRDRELAGLLARRKEIEAAIQNSSYGPAHVYMRRLRDDLGAVNRQIDNRASEVRRLLADGDLIVRLPDSVDQMDLDALRVQRQHYADARQDLSQRIAGMNQTLSEISALRSQIADLQAKRDQVQTELDKLNVERDEHRPAGRVEIVQRGDIPLATYSDKRAAFAFVGGGLGAGAGIALVALWGLLHRQYRYIEDLNEPSFTAPLLGCLPDLSSRSSEQEEHARWSIHQIRNLLQMRAGEREDRGNLYAVTSPESGDGKTSLSLALAISFARSGKKTLLVDLDLVGRGLSRQLNLSEQPGLSDAVLHNHVNGEVHATEVPGLMVVPAGVSRDVDDGTLSRTRLQRIFDPLRTQYEAIVVDTGPVLGSLEANILCGIADGVLVTVSRGQNAKLVEAAIERVRWLGADCVGLVFNRASTRDLERSASHSVGMSVRSQPAAAQGRRRSNRPIALVRALGPSVPENIVGERRAK